MNEIVDVLTISRKGRGIVVPILIKWRNQRYRVKEIGLSHPKQIGRVLHHIFEGSDGRLTFRLDYNTESLQWTLIGTSDGLPN